MPKIIETTVYLFNELSEEAKEKARNWYRAGMHDDYQWSWDTVQEDAKNIGLELKSYDVDSASFVRNMEGEFSIPALQVAEKILADHGSECETYKTAERLWDQLNKEPENEELQQEFLDSLLTDYSAMLQKEFEYRDSPECIDDNIIANEYTFTEKGKRF